MSEEVNKEFFIQQSIIDEARAAFMAKDLPKSAWLTALLTEFLYCCKEFELTKDEIFFVVGGTFDIVERTIARGKEGCQKKI